MEPLVEAVIKRAVQAALAANEQQALGQEQEKELDGVPSARLVEPVVLRKVLEAEPGGEAIREQAVEGLGG